MVTLVRQLGRAWHAFLFEPADARSLAWLRIALGAYLLFYYVDLFPFVRLHFFPEGLLPPSTLTDFPKWLLIRHIQYAFLPRLALYGLTLLAALSLLLGYQTRVAALLGFVLNQSWLSMPGGRNSGDNVVSVLCFLMLVAALPGHVQAVCALDAPKARRGNVPYAIPAWTRRLFQLQLALIYLSTGFHKCASPVWYKGEALYYVFQQPVWSRVDLSWITHPIPIGLLTYGTLIFEALIFPVLVWPKVTRHAVLLAGVAFHLGISLTMRVFVFGEIMPLFYLCFVDADVVQAVLVRLRAASSRLAIRAPRRRSLRKR